MDDKLQNQINPVQTSQSTPNVVQPPPTPAKESGDNKKTLMWFVGGLVLVILIVGGMYLFLSSQQQKSQTAPTPRPKAAVEENLEEDLDTVNIEDVEGEFTTVDSDLRNL